MGYVEFGGSVLLVATCAITAWGLRYTVVRTRGLMKVLYFAGFSLTFLWVLAVLDLWWWGLASPSITTPASMALLVAAGSVGISSEIYKNIVGRRHKIEEGNG